MQKLSAGSVMSFPLILSLASPEPVEGKDDRATQRFLMPILRQAQDDTAAAHHVSVGAV